ncbi:MAG: thiamine pyrophosphate-dependent enzyme [Chlamydiales bacterium]
MDAFKTVKKRLNVLKLIYISRFADKKMAILAKQNKGGTFQLSSAGHELVGVICGQMLESGRDWSLPYYRDQGFVIGLGCDLTELFGAFLGRETKNHSGGRMMPNHYSHKALRIICQSSVVGSQFLHGVGRGWANKRLKNQDIVYVSAGDGATSEGDFHEALNFASIHLLSVIFVIQDNGWAISVPSKEQTAGGTIASMARGYKGLEVYEIDGTDYEETTEAMAGAIRRGRAGQGPTLLVAHVPRLAPHSNSDDPQKYQTKEMIENENQRDPMHRLEDWLMQQNKAYASDISQLQKEALEEVEQAALRAHSIAFPKKGSSRSHIFVPFAPPPCRGEGEGEKIVMMDGLNHALSEEMAYDQNVVVFGQDVAHGKGGVFGVTRGLTDQYGDSRCFNTPLAESTIIGMAIGMGVDGLHKPVAEIQFADYLWTGINQLFNEASSLYYRSNGEWQVPIVVRMPYGGYIQGGPYHSQSIEGFLTHCPGLKVVIPSNAADAKGLLKTAIRDPNPVIFLEHKGLYRQQKFCARLEPPKDYLLPFGQANIVQIGLDITVVCWGMMVVMAWEIGEKLAKEGISIEVIDLRTLVPLDHQTILASVKKTGKLLIAHEAPRNCGFGAEISAQVAEQALEYLDGPIHRVCGFDSVVPYSKSLENEVLPQSIDLENAIRKLARY